MRFKLFRFKGGIHPPEEKELTKDKPIREMPPPDRVAVLLHQHTGAPCKPLVKEGQKVRTGQKVGDIEAFVSAPVHATITGVVEEIRPFVHPALGRLVDAVVIKKEEEEWEEPIRGHSDDWTSLSPASIRKIVREAGIVGLGGAAFPTHVKLSPPQPVDIAIGNGCECEPYLTTDHRVMLERPEAVIEGLRIVMHTVGAKRGLIGVEDNKPDAAEALRRCLAQHEEIEVSLLPTKYPQGSEKQLIKALTGREVPPGGLPFHVGVVVQNVGTLAAIRDAVVEGRPLVSRVITVTGRGVCEPSNLEVRIGTLFSAAVEFCGGLVGELGKVTSGGPMTGVAQASLDVPVVKGTSGILLMPRSEVEVTDSGPCLNCGRCVDVCPMGLVPATIALYAERGRLQDCQAWGAMDCIECGSCSYVCPSKRSLVHWLKLARAELTAKGK